MKNIQLKLFFNLRDKRYYYLVEQIRLLIQKFCLETDLFEEFDKF